MTQTSIRAALAGISGVHVTPYGVDGGINRSLMARVVDRIAVAGIHNIVSAGNTGEYYALTPDEVRLVHDVAIEANAGRAKLTAAVEENVLVQLEHLKTHPCVAAALTRKDLALYGWVYKFESGEVFAYDQQANQFLPLSTKQPRPARKRAPSQVI